MLNTTHLPDDYLTIPGVRAEYGFSRQTVYKWMGAGLEPDGFLVDGRQRRPIWRRTTIEAWIDDPTRTKHRPKQRKHPSAARPQES